MVTIDGIDVHIEGEGAETLVMIHGWPDTFRLWDGQVEALKGRYRCVRFTLPGYDCTKPARSPSLDDLVRTFAEIVDHASPGRPVTLVLHDWGCVFGYQYAMRRPERVARIVAIDIGDTNSGAFLRSLSLKAKLMAAFYQLWLALAWKVRGGVGTWMTRWMARQLGCRSEPAYITWQMNYPYWLTWTGGLKKSVRVEPQCPVLFLYGTRKPFMFHSPQWEERIASSPGSEVKAFRTGHWVMVQAPGEVNAAMLAWLDKASPSART